jgi:hypothetical protein
VKSNLKDFALPFSQCQPWHRQPNAIGSQQQSQHRVVRYRLAEMSSRCKKWQPIEADGNLMEPMVTNISNGEQCLTHRDQYFTNVD